MAGIDHDQRPIGIAVHPWQWQAAPGAGDGYRDSGGGALSPVNDHRRRRGCRDDRADHRLRLKPHTPRTGGACETLCIHRAQVERQATAAIGKAAAGDHRRFGEVEHDPAATIAAYTLSHRPYRAARSVPESLAELREHIGTQFCPTVIAALESIWHERPELLSSRDRRLHAVAS